MQQQINTHKNSLVPAHAMKPRSGWPDGTMGWPTEDSVMLPVGLKSWGSVLRDALCALNLWLFLRSSQGVEMGVSPLTVTSNNLPAELFPPVCVTLSSAGLKALVLMAEGFHQGDTTMIPLN